MNLRLPFTIEFVWCVCVQQLDIVNMPKFKSGTNIKENKKTKENNSNKVAEYFKFPSVSL